MNFSMWKKALNVIPSVTKDEWDRLDLISKWLISTRAAVPIMTFLSAALAGLFALRDGAFQFLPWLALVMGLIFAHATNNLFNDYTDFKKGVDKDNYFRTYSLAPGNQANHFKDQKGNKVIRTQAGGNTQEFKWEGGKKVVVTFGGSASSSRGGDGAAGAIAVGDMARYCAGEASAKFMVNPRDITTQNAKQTQGMYEVWGQYPAQPSPQVFICSFNAERQFLSVDLYRP